MSSRTPVPSAGSGAESAGAESTLIARAQRGDLEAFNALIVQYQDRAFTLAYRILDDRAAAADAAQAALIAAFRRLNTYRGGSFRGWLLRITANQCYDELRRRRRTPSVAIEDLPGADDDDGAPLADPGETPEQIAQRRELERAVQTCIAALPPDQRVALVLCDVEAFDYQTIADTLRIALGTVKSRVSRARAAVRECLQSVRELLPASYRLMNN